MVELMGNVIIPENEAQRLAALHRYHLLNSSIEDSFNNIARLMAEAFDVPIALVNLVDRDKVFFKGNVGMPEVTYTDRNVSLCSFAILSPEPTVFDKPLDEPCLLSNPLVHGEFGLRFYAGAPLSTPDGYNIGSVCLVDKKERSFSAKQQAILERFAKLAMEIIELQQDAVKQAEVEEQLVASNKELQFVTDTMPQLVWATEPDGYSFFFNKRWFEYTGLTFNDVKGEGWTQSLHPHDYEPTLQAWQRAVEHGSSYDVEYRLRRHDGVYRWFIARGTPMRNDQGEIVKWYGTTTDIHDQKLAQEDLRQSKERFELVSKATQDAIWDWNLVTNEIWWNEGFKELFGYQAEEIESTVDSWYNRVHPDDKERVVGGIHRLIDKGGKQWTDEYRFRKKDGSYAIVFDRGYALHAEDGKPIRMLGSMQDVTEQKKFEIILAESEKRFRTLTQNSPDLITRHGKDFRYLYASPIIEKFTGIKPEDFIGKSYYDLPIPQDLCPIFDEHLSQVFQTRKPHHMEYTASTNGTEVNIFSRLVPEFDEQGELVSVLVISTDVTERKKAEAGIKENEERFRTLANSIAQLAWMADGEGSIYWYNQRFYDYTGSSLDEMQGTGWQKIHHPDHLPIVLELMQYSREKGEPWETTVPLKGKDGTYRWFLSRVYPVKDSEGKVVQWIGTNTDITEQKQAETVLEERVKERTLELEKRNAELEQFTYVSHHDLQEPLRKIILFTDLVKTESQDKLSETSQKRMDKVIDASRRMSGALRDVLDYARLNKEEQFTRIDLDDVLAAVQSDLEIAIAEKNAKIFSGNMPTLKAMPQQMHQLFYNLLNNAIKFSKTDEAPVIHISCAIPNAAKLAQHPELDQKQLYYEITVSDNGIGFGTNAAEKIFGMFQRLHARTAYEGTGIGLALCRKVAINHKGKIWAESVEGKGATFRILLPLVN